MCQTKEEGGRRCIGKNPLASNYPSYVAIDKKSGEIILKEDSFSERPALALHAAVLAARSGYPLSDETRKAGEKASERFHEIPTSEVWEQWNYIALANKPSVGLEAIHQMGWEKHFPELAAIRGVPQSPHWHPEGSVEIHTQQAADVAASRARQEGLNESETRVAVMGAICHDFGKAVSTTIDEDGKISSGGHDETGMPLAQSFLKRIGASKDVMNQVPAIVREHMCHANNPTPKSVRKLTQRLESVGSSLEAWGRVAEADRGGRGSASTSGISKVWLDAKAKAEQDQNKKTKDLVNSDLLREMGHHDTTQYGTIIPQAREAQAAGLITSKEDGISWLKANQYIK